MKRRELASLLRHPLLQLEGFVLRGRLLFKPPLDRLLRGIFSTARAIPARSTQRRSLCRYACRPTIFTSLSVIAFERRQGVAAGAPICLTWPLS